MFNFKYFLLILLFKCSYASYEQQFEDLFPDGYDHFNNILKSKANNGICDILNITDTLQYECNSDCFWNKTIRAEHKTCEIARSSCKDQGKFDRFNFFSFYGCYLGAYLEIYLPIACIIIYIIFKITAEVVDNYITSGITYVTERTGISDAFAAVTLLALANGAGNVITSIVVQGNGAAGISYNIGAQFGSAFFVCSLVIAIVIFQELKRIQQSSTVVRNISNNPTDGIKVEKSTVYRDIFFFIFSSLLCIFYGFQQEITWLGALILLLIYVVMVICVYIQDKIDRKNEKDEEKSDTQQIEEEYQDINPHQRNKRKSQTKDTQANMIGSDGIKIKKQNSTGNIDDKNYKSLQIQKEDSDEEEVIGQKKTPNDSSAGTPFRNNVDTKKIQIISPIISPFKKDFKQSSLNPENLKEITQELEIPLIRRPSLGSMKSHKSYVSYALSVRSARLRDEKMKEFKELSILEKIETVLYYPFKLLVLITIPPCDPEDFNKNLCIAWPFPGTVFIFWALSALESPYFLYIGMPVAFVLTIFFYFTLKDLKQGDLPPYFILIIIISMIVALLWTFVVIDMLVDLLNTFTCLFRLNVTFMGLTVLAIGNALPDAFTTIAMVRQGHAQMGITGSYAGQLFGFLIGFGFSCLVNIIQIGHPIEFDLFQKPVKNLLNLVVIGFSTLNLVLTSIWVIACNYTFRKSLAYICLVCYAGFFISALAIQLWYIIDDVKEAQ